MFSPQNTDILAPNPHLFQPQPTIPCEEYTKCIPYPKHMPKYTKAKVLLTQDKQHVS